MTGLLLTTPITAEPLQVTALGDSLVQGYGLPQEDGFVPQLQVWLAERGHDITLTNAGVSGDTSAGGLSRLDWTLTPETDALIILLGGNDALRGIDPTTTRGNLDAILAAAGNRDLPVLLLGVPAPANYGPDYQQAFAAMWTELAETHDALLVEDYLAPLRNPDGPKQELFQPDGLHPNKGGVKIAINAIGPQVEALLGQINHR
ncbi:arylesterase [Qingshengfaniella alkalisoli]|uniref:Arylesterase n=1 Tax=Qingshengfaniella alkalisoli TaxID=2599296 RepID=A0A5B8ICJ3_9RHOB|nr:arylesterase [Qingshengfaniella alkalisoli]QDY71316.1 arylesterase [Qingshengfaniella alkalisoli]